MISIRHFLDRAKGDDSSATYARAFSLLLESLAVHSVSRDEKSHIEFREAVRALRRNSEEAASAAQILAVTAGIIQLHEANGRDMEDFIRIQTKERQEIVQMLSETLIAVTQEGAHSGANLGQIAHDLESASQVDDLRVLKGRLQESLRSIVTESARHKDSAEVVAKRLRARLQNAQEGAQELDPVTGLPGVAAAQLYLDLAIQSSSPIYAVVLCVERLEAINARFGYTLGDRLLDEVCPGCGAAPGGRRQAVPLARSHSGLPRWSAPVAAAARRQHRSRPSGPRQARGMDRMGRPLGVAFRFGALSGGCAEELSRRSMTSSPQSIPPLRLLGRLAAKFPAGAALIVVACVGFSRSAGPGRRVRQRQVRQRQVRKQQVRKQVEQCLAAVLYSIVPLSILGVIPARYASSRFPGKALVSIGGKTMLQHVWERASQARYLSSVVVATDDERIRQAAESFGARVVMTRADHVSGTDRVAEAASASPAQLVVNIQGDEPMLDPAAIDAAVLGLLEDDGVPA